MLRVVFSSFFLVISLASLEANALGVKAFREFCESLLGPSHARQAREFETTVDALADAHMDVPEAEYIGERILNYPDLYLRPYRADKPTPLAPLMRTPDLAQVFFSAHKFNGLAAYDFMAIARRSQPDPWREAIAGAMRTVVVTPAGEMQARYPAFDVAMEQARALDLCRWIGSYDEQIIAAAFSFLDPSLTRFRRRSKLGSLGRRAYSAADFIHRLTREGDISRDRVEWLVANALNLGHPFRTHYWTALVPQSLDDAQIERLAHAWTQPVLIESERKELRLKSKRLIERVEALIRRTPRKFKNLR